ncbi:porin family protein [Flavobacterium sp. Fl-77]|uniref:Porin family protein n=1 Tax=Flavobacterium flavipigmentatum TaxID=2893884 RepID=A0AAJ2S843_9FLAO|nr:MULTISPECIES: porin family protein [unclassified Flavobacterium]MDX6182456.1 porin family protein [Flavobacterium sp. Fl-33]MDX6185631.1 porin family protein [Flavobacterium sp. Fl-77]UFH38816.1 PorT family protein [Flavobacterium sp. F-70]
MKKILLAAVLLVATSATLQAQFLRIGVKGGVNFANQTGDASLEGVAFDKDGITSFHAGLVAELKLLDRFAIQPELLYSTQGASYKNAVDEFKNELGYLSIPVMAKLYLTDSFSLEVGPQASFLLSEKNDFDVKDAETFEFGVNAGLGFKITKSLFIQGRYSLGLTEASKNADVKNSTVQLSAGFLF